MTWPDVVGGRNQKTCSARKILMLGKAAKCFARNASLLSSAAQSAHHHGRGETAVVQKEDVDGEESTLPCTESTLALRHVFVLDDELGTACPGL
eukprot:CAMPEP_0206422130 /NCGR_PEP_ID=MMETSP0324_2-20121206/1893_1 /ASSEMBLY_ACC=CAM_ASM_000836 /TAXON_ID=2866 /ORGANISM="Crypthecodinium cohnii, Strain Seligo" /LENGTH=93 /DNA_ID=CAMNT_0053886423 /DNA_START=141 /DNA_END=423 /DNA_ORIENTATION=-